jgi:tRNA-specific 2-thiouridylase
MKPRVLLGMSGGVDSSVSAFLLQEMGYEVVGVSFLFYGEEDDFNDGFTDAGNLADKLNIRHFIVDLRTDFRNVVVNYFINEYKVGKTPFPCAWCNPQMKFKALLQYADTEKCDWIATGHYAQVKSYNSINFIFEGVDPDKDQSFFLWGLKPLVLDKLILPLGSYTKSEIRNLAAKRGFGKLSEKKDSLGICFTPNGDYREFLKNEGIFSEPGNFVNPKGEILGMHSGIINYTVGQRRGLGVNLNFPVFVAEIRPDDNEILLAEFSNLYRTKVFINNTQFIDIQEINPHKIYNVKMRYRLQLTPCNLNILKEGRAEVRLLKPEAMISAGQTAVFYDGARVIGGGFIEKSE